jgi:hypothetical protein
MQLCEPVTGKNQVLCRLQTNSFWKDRGNEEGRGMRDPWRQYMLLLFAAIWYRRLDSVKNDLI